MSPGSSARRPGPLVVDQDMEVMGVWKGVYVVAGCEPAGLSSDEGHFASLMGDSCPRPLSLRRGHEHPVEFEKDPGPAPRERLPGPFHHESLRSFDVDLDAIHVDPVRSAIRVD